MEKLNFLPNGQWELLEKSKSSNYTFRHEYSDPMEREKGWTGTPSNLDVSTEDLNNLSEYDIPTRRHYFSVHHPEHGNLGIIPATTSEFGKDDVDFNGWGYQPTDFPNKNGTHNHDNKSLMNNAKKFTDNLSSKSIKYDDVIKPLINHLSSVKQGVGHPHDVANLHSNTKTTPLEYINIKPNQRLQ